jgi:hypothetical protein
VLDDEMLTMRPHDVDEALPIRELDVVEPLETVEPGGVDQNGDRAQLLADARQCGVDLRAIGDVGGERELRLGRFEVDGRDLVAVFAESLRDGQADSGAAAGDHGRSHVVTRAETVTGTKNLPSEYENLTLTLQPLARRLRNRIQPGKTLKFASSHSRYEYASLVSSVQLNCRWRNVRFARDENEIIHVSRRPECHRTTRPRPP